MTQKIHPTAIIDSAAKLGSEVSIGAYSVIGPDVTIGDGGGGTEAVKHLITITKTKFW